MTSRALLLKRSLTSLGFLNFALLQPSFDAMERSQGFMVAHGLSVTHLWLYFLFFNVVTWLGILVLLRLEAETFVLLSQHLSPFVLSQVRRWTKLSKAQSSRQSPEAQINEPKSEQILAPSAPLRYATFSCGPLCSPVVFALVVFSAACIGSEWAEGLAAYLIGVIIASVIFLPYFRSILLPFSIFLLVAQQGLWLANVGREQLYNVNSVPYNSALLPADTNDAISEQVSRDILVVVFDELSWLALSPNGSDVDQKYPNFARAQRSGITLTGVSTPYAFTEWAVPGMFSARESYSSLSDEEFREASRYFPILEVASRDYTILSNSASLPCDVTGCDFLSPPKAGFTSTVLDVTAVMGSTRFPAPLNRIFPNTSFSFSDFWTRGNPGVDADSTDFGERRLNNPARLNENGGFQLTTSAGTQLLQIPSSTQPYLIILHSYIAHHPWAFDETGRDIASGQVNEFDDAYLPFWCSGSRYICSDELNNLSRWTYLNSVVAADRELGRIVEQATSLLENPLIIITADHGTSFPTGTDGRRHTEAAHLPGLVRVPFLIFDPSTPLGGLHTDAIVTHGKAMETAFASFNLTTAEFARRMLNVTSNVTPEFTSVREGSASSERATSVNLLELSRSPNWNSSMLSSLDSGLDLGADPQEMTPLPGASVRISAGQSDLAIYQVHVPRRCMHPHLVVNERSVPVAMEPTLPEENNRRGWTIAERGNSAEAYCPNE